MKILRSFLALILTVSLFLSVGYADGRSSDGSIKVDGYTKKDGTYVAPHNRTAPNATKNDNWSTKGNVNPYTGQPGTKPRDGETTMKRSRVSTVPVSPEPAQRTRAVLKATVDRCNQLLDSYVHAPFGQSPFNAAMYEQIRLERDLALGELKAGH